MSDDQVEIRTQFRDAVNMSPSELREWLDTDESRSVGDTGGDGESTGHRSGRRILELKEKNVDELTDDDHDWMNKGRFGFQRGSMVGSRSQLGRPA